MAKQSARAGKAAAAQVVSLQKDPKRALVFKVKPQPRAGVRTRRQVEDVLVRRAFQARSRFPAVSEVRVLAEGDSWINIVWPISGYPPTLVNSLDMRASSTSTISAGRATSSRTSRTPSNMSSR